MSLWSIKAMASYNVRLVCGTLHSAKVSLFFLILRSSSAESTNASCRTTGSKLFEIAIVFLMRFHKVCSRNFKCIAYYYPFHIQSIKEKNDRFREGRAEKKMALQPNYLPCYLILLIWNFSYRRSKIIHIQFQKKFCHMVNCV